jgi:hypothetical protein
METVRFRNGKSCILVPGSGINVPDPQHWPSLSSSKQEKMDPDPRFIATGSKVGFKTLV